MESDSATVWDLALFQVWLAGLWTQVVFPGVRVHPNHFLSRKMAQAEHLPIPFPTVVFVPEG